MAESQRGRPVEISEDIREYLLSYPEAKNIEIARKFSCSTTTVYKVQRALRDEGLIPPAGPSGRRRLTEDEIADRKVQRVKNREEWAKIKNEKIEKRRAMREKVIQANKNREITSDPVDEIIEKFKENVETSLPSPVDENTLLTGQQMIEIASASDNLDENDEDVRRDYLRKLRNVVSSSNYTIETQIAAMAMWTKLKDAVRAKELGPGKPLTRAAAILRFKKLFIAAGPEVVFEALSESFDLEGGGKNEGKVSTNQSTTTSSPSGVVAA